MALSWPRFLSGPRIWLVCAAMLAGGSAFGQPSGTTSWRALTPAQRAALAPLEREWGRIDAPRQQKWLEVADRFPSLPQEERQRLQQRMVDWTRLTPEQRGRARMNFKEAGVLAPDERQELWQAYQALPADQKRRLAERGQAPRNPVRVPDKGRGETSAKRNIVAIPPSPNARTVAPTVVQARPGATTRLLSKPDSPPLHQQTGLPKIAATPGFVDSATLLPRRGAQGAATQPSAAASRTATGRPQRPD